MRPEEARGDNSAETIPIRTGADVSRVRRSVATAMAIIGASRIETTRMVTAASELARNTLDYGGGGEVLIAVVGTDDTPQGGNHLHRPGAGNSRHRSGVEGWT